MMSSLVEVETIMAKKIFVWAAHPMAGSLSEAIADAYQAGANKNGADVRRMNLSEMNFDMDNFTGYTKDMPDLEKDLLDWQENIRWADHVFIVHPYWWGAMPAKAKMVFDRALSSGFAYKYHKKGVKWDKLLSGKTAEAVITSDTPPLIDTFIYGRTGRKVLKSQVLEFCGFKVKKILQLGSVKLADDTKIKGWLKNTQDMGATAAA